MCTLYLCIQFSSSSSQNINEMRKLKNDWCINHWSISWCPASMTTLIRCPSTNLFHYLFSVSVLQGLGTIVQTILQSIPGRCSSRKSCLFNQHHWWLLSVLKLYPSTPLYNTRIFQICTYDRLNCLNCSHFQ